MYDYVDCNTNYTFQKLVNKAEYGLLEQFLYWVNLTVMVFRIPLSYTVGVSTFFSSLLVFLIFV
jgi:hypothetical protein